MMMTCAKLLLRIIMVFVSLCVGVPNRRSLLHPPRKLSISTVFNHRIVTDFRTVFPLLLPELLEFTHVAFSHFKYICKY